MEISIKCIYLGGRVLLFIQHIDLTLPAVPCAGKPFFYAEIADIVLFPPLYRYCFVHFFLCRYCLVPFFYADIVLFPFSFPQT